MLSAEPYELALGAGYELCQVEERCFQSVKH